MINDKNVSTNQKNNKGSIEKYDLQSFEKEQLPYAIIPNEVIQEFGPKHPVPFAIWSYLQSKPPTWDPNKYELMKTFTISERTYHAHMKCLVNVNLVKYLRYRAPNGQLGPVTIHVLNGSKLSKNADTNQTANICIVDANHTAKNPQCGDATLWSDCAHINKRKNTLIKENNINKKEKSPSLISELLTVNPHNLSQTLIEDWIEVRQKKRSPITATAWTRLMGTLHKCQEAGYEPIECFEIMVEHGWTSIKIEWIKNLKKGSEKKQTREEQQDDTSWIYTDEMRQRFKEMESSNRKGIGHE